MHIVIATSGTHGDLRPFVALAQTLIARGHTVCITGSIDFEAFVLSHNITFLRLQGSIQDILKMDGVKISSPFRLIISIPKMAKAGLKLYHEGLTNIWTAVNGSAGAPKADIIIAHPKCTYAEDSAQALSIPCIMAAFQPLHKTADFPMIVFGGKNFGRMLNKISYLPLKIQAYVQLKKRNQVRHKLMGLAPIKAKTIWQNYIKRQTLYAFSSHLQAKPKDWPENTHICGFWSLNEPSNWQPDPELQQFLDAGSPPIYIGFGSMPISSMKPINIILDAISKWGGRAIIATGTDSLWEKLSSPWNDNFFLLESAPHDQLFQHVAAVVHHGGAGSTAAGLKAGKPTLILPHAMDQPYWGRIVYENNCGPKPIPFTKIKSVKLSEALGDLSQNQVYTTNAKNMAEKFESEDALNSSAKYIEQLI